MINRDKNNRLPARVERPATLGADQIGNVAVKGVGGGARAVGSGRVCSRRKYLSEAIDNNPPAGSDSGRHDGCRLW